MIRTALSSLLLLAAAPGCTSSDFEAENISIEERACNNPASDCRIYDINFDMDGEDREMSGLHGMWIRAGNVEVQTIDESNWGCGGAPWQWADRRTDARQVSVRIRGTEDPTFFFSCSYSRVETEDGVVVHDRGTLHQIEVDGFHIDRKRLLPSGEVEISLWGSMRDELSSGWTASGKGELN